MATNFRPSLGSYVLNKFPSISQWSDTGPSWPSCFCQSAWGGAIKSHLVTALVSSVLENEINLFFYHIITSFNDPEKETLCS